MTILYAHIRPRESSLVSLCLRGARVFDYSFSAVLDDVLFCKSWRKRYHPG